MPRQAEVLSTEFAHIVRTPGVVGDEPHIAGRRIRVRDIVAARDLGGCTPEEIAATVYPDLTLSEVYSALAFYEDHRDEVNQAAEAEARMVKRFRRQHSKLIGKLPAPPRKKR